MRLTFAGCARCTDRALHAVVDTKDSRPSLPASPVCHSLTGGSGRGGLRHSNLHRASTRTTNPSAETAAWVWFPPLAHRPHGLCVPQLLLHPRTVDASRCLYLYRVYRTALCVGMQEPLTQHLRVVLSCKPRGICQSHIVQADADGRGRAVAAHVAAAGTGAPAATAAAWTPHKPAT
jgi:hypothetical protein